MTERPFCNRCFEDFTLSEERSPWRMGFLRPLSKAPRRWQARWKRESEIRENNYLCGNCFYDLQEAEEDAQ